VIFSNTISLSINIHKSLSKVLFVDGGPKILLISFMFDRLIISSVCFFSRFRTPCFFTTLFKEQAVIKIIINNKFSKNFMNKEYLNIYNNFISLTTNKKLYQQLTTQDTFSDRLTLFLLHFAFFLKNFKEQEGKKKLQEIYDFIFRQIELSIREIGYGDQSINKKMKDYINLFHSIVSEIHFWEDYSKIDKKNKLSLFIENMDKNDYLVDYFNDFKEDLSKKNLNYFLKSVSNQ
jgi:cytochrome b pre-mRNA-processing protein 3